jgi:hypothetical protein
MAWQHRTLDSAEELAPSPPRSAPDEAQQSSNFIVWSPAPAPAGYEVRPGTLRMEAPPGVPSHPTEGRTPWSANNTAAYRYEIIEGDRRLRIKQFLYDWAFPALDHPCLWESATRATPLDDEHVLWHGVDYLGHPAASARLGRTTVELSVLAGSFTDEEVTELYRSLAPADPAAAEAIARVPLAGLSYWARRADASPVKVPIGLWTFHRGGHTPAWRAGGPAPLGLPSMVGGLELDSVGEFAYPDGRGDVEAVYAGGRRRAREIRVIAQPIGRGGLTLPAAPDKHPGSFEEIEVDGVPVQLAWIDGRYGPFNAVLRTGEVELMVLAGTSPAIDRDAFLRTIAELLR